MKKKTRKFLFYAAVAVFAILSYLIVMFALGYKYDFVQGKFLKTGSFQLSTNIDAQIYLNDEFAGATSFLTNSFFKTRLLPRTYTVRAQQENNQTWQKLITVEAGRFVDFPKVVLLPESDEFEETAVASISLTGTLKASFIPKQKIVVVVNSKKQTEIFSLQSGEKIKSILTPSPTPRATPQSKSTSGKGEEKIGILSPDGEKNLGFTDHEIWVRWVKDAGYQPYKKAGEEELITRFSQNVRDVQWYFDSAHVIADVGGILKLIEVDDRDGINIMDIGLVAGEFYYDRSNNSIYKIEERNLVRIYLK